MRCIAGADLRHLRRGSHGDRAFLPRVRGAGSTGTSTSRPPGAAPVRKTVTVIFADLAGSTTSRNRSTPRRRARSSADTTPAAADRERHRAGVTKYIGDGFMAVWGVPEIGPEDAAHAVDAAVELQERFVDLAAQVAETPGRNSLCASR